MARIWILGGGLIGCGWAAAFAGAGHEVTVIDPDPAVADRIATVQAQALPVLRGLGTLNPLATTPRHVASAAEAGAPPVLVQENLPERLDLKRRALAALEPHLAPDTIIASSSSGLSPDDMADGLARPERLLIAHPCNPPYLMPVVELSGGALTAPEVVARTADLFRAMGKTVLTLTRPVPGHLVNRLQAALWREAVHLASEGIASLADIEQAVIQGLAPRWCIVGPSTVFHLAGAEGGIGRFVDALGPEFERWWATLGDPRLDAATRARLVSGMAAADPRPVAEIAAGRDAGLTELMVFLSKKEATPHNETPRGNQG
ncbi:3-hydroxyacyl-CoA dehydrogenase NAD-binding domain-containing protein (plasmid) [Tistrella mobilis]|uniref:3-hydroxyacyl-CoA dehydrogenase family protein n=1 Tax=Tistrella mobilis TaxID=171437 RepID=UPI0035575B1B